MRASTRRRFRSIAVWLALETLFFAGLLALSALADTPDTARKIPVNGCYCHCAQTKTAAGCVKLCELPKYASRWWAVKCAKPRLQRPLETPDAGPHFPHPQRNERASN